MNDAGAALADYQDRVFVGLKTKRVQVDEIWSFTYAKEKNVASAKAAPEWAGDTWTWTAIDADSKLVMSWLVGGRDGEYAMAFIDDLSRRLANRVQLTSDGHKAYLGAVEEAFGDAIDYAQLIKLYGDVPDSAKGRYSPRRLHRHPQGSRNGAPRKGGRLNIVRRTPEPHDAHAHAPLHPVSQMAFPKRSKTTRTLWRFTSPITTSSASIRPCASRQRWRPA